MAYELGRIRTDRGEFLDKGNLGVDPRHPDFAGGARGDNLHDDAAAFADASTFAVANGIGLVVGPGTFKISSDITISAAVHLMAGAKILPDTGVTVTFGGAFSASASQHFETGDGTILFSTDSTVEEVNILWWGAVADSGTTDNRAAIMGCVNSLQGRGGVVKVPDGGGEYFGVSATMTFVGVDYANITIRGDGWGSWIKHTTVDPGSDYYGVIGFQGVGAYSLHNIAVETVRISGASTADRTKILLFSGVDGVRVDGVRFDTNDSEGVYFNAPADSRNVWVTNCYGSEIGQTFYGGLSAFNLNANNAHCQGNTLKNVGQFVEHTGFGLVVRGNLFDTAVNIGMLLLSTWSGWTDPDTGAEANSERVIVQGNVIRNAPSGVTVGDYDGRTVGATNYRGNIGRIIVDSNIFYKVSKPIAMGQDEGGLALITNNLFEDALSATTACVELNKGPAVVRGNVFKKGATSVWAYLVKADGSNESHVIEANISYGQTWTTVAFWLAGTRATLGANRLIANGDTIVGAVLRLGNAAGFQQVIIPDVEYTAETCYSSEVLSRWAGFAEPEVFSWKVGDEVKNTLPASAGYLAWLCTVAGTAGTLNSGSTTGSITTGTAALTLSATTGLYPGAMITIVGVTGSFTILSLDYTTKIATLSANADATVAAAAVAYKVPTFKTAGLIS